MKDTGDSLYHGNVRKLIADVLVTLFSDNNMPVLIAVGGPGGSGKTTFALQLKKLLGDADIVSLDNYKIPRELRVAQDTWGSHPDASYLNLIKTHLYELKMGNTVEIPLYDIESGRAMVTNKYGPKRYNIIEGEISTFELFSPFIDFSIFIDSNFKTQLSARLIRDVAERGHTYEKAITNFLKSNIREYVTFGAVGKRRAQVILYSQSDYSLQIQSVQESLIPVFNNCYKNSNTVAVEGLIVPLCTPFDQNGEICKGALIDHIQWLYDRGVRRLLVSGTTAEFFSLTALERLLILDIVRENFQGMILFQTGCNSLKDTLELQTRAIMHGADVIMALPPYYYASLPEQGIIEYFKVLAEQCTVPFYLYNFPKHTGNPLTAGILHAVTHDGIKDSAGDYELLQSTPKFLAGSSSKIIQAVKNGAHGFVSAMANVYPDLYVALERELAVGNMDSAGVVQQTIAGKKELMPDVPEIILLKKLLKKLITGYPDYVRPPLYCSNTDAVL